jgi:hypothetical protein
VIADLTWLGPRFSQKCVSAGKQKQLLRLNGDAAPRSGTFHVARHFEAASCARLCPWVISSVHVLINGGMSSHACGLATGERSINAEKARYDRVVLEKDLFGTWSLIACRGARDSRRGAAVVMSLR